MLAQNPAEQDWYRIADATIASTDELARLVLAKADLPSATLRLRRSSTDGWDELSSFAEVPRGDLVVKAVVGQSGGHS